MEQETDQIKVKIQQAENWFQANCTKVIVAFSGGVDSCLVAFFARKYLGKENALAVIADSPSLKRKDLEIGKAFCEQLDINLEMVKTHELENPNYASNPINRCYFCKFTLYDELKLIAVKYPGTDILNGQNFDDLGDYRPGIKAAKEFKVLKPLADCNFTKKDIREMALHFDLPTWNKPASPCLSSRIPYGQEVTVGKLRQIEEAENMLNALGFEEVRVRHFGEVAKVEVPKDQLKALKIHEKSIRENLKEIGFESCELDDEGLVSGKLNRAIA
ncbi:UNVERIFIED_CONTAM: hypothetical protein GTU68_013813 [Idotea baltica]|nr:hypothetical protein [Idotea baltica]